LKVIVGSQRLVSWEEFAGGVGYARTQKESVRKTSEEETYRKKKDANRRITEKSEENVKDGWGNNSKAHVGGRGRQQS